MTSLGIDELEAFLVFCATEFKAVEDALADDGHISKPEALGIALSAVARAWHAFSGISKVVAEAQDIDEAENERLYQAVANALKITPGSRALDIYSVLFDMIRGMSKSFGDLREVWRNRNLPTTP